ncbi:Hsp20/alpha crystallin family protein [Fischerella sp. PCC 9605]|uniref:Hsp20/alpha crystallin family protein n=1 Tax=Fischerella sp. PCC 9605 TaxID=1173024 RepID=UPI00047ACE8B|nr:Hsp20/alpha crystallin family protein [Fischerella sp. PCC 9605]
MPLIRWDPFREINRYDPFREITSLQREMNRLFDRMMTTSGDEGEMAGYAFIPAAEMHENPDNIELRIELPGMEAKDLDVKVTAEAVSISGERKAETRTEEKGMRRSEFRYGSFQRVIPLPTRIQNDRVQAEFKNGLLCLTMPKAEEEKKKVVTINLGEQQTQAIGEEYDRQTQQQLQSQSS